MEEQAEIVSLTGMFYTVEYGIVELWYPDGDFMATVEDNLGLRLSAIDVANTICKTVNGEVSQWKRSQ